MNTDYKKYISLIVSTCRELLRRGIPISSAVSIEDVKEIIKYAQEDNSIAILHLIKARKKHLVKELEKYIEGYKDSDISVYSDKKEWYYDHIDLGDLIRKTKNYIDALSIFYDYLILKLR